MAAGGGHRDGWAPRNRWQSKAVRAISPRLALRLFVFTRDEAADSLEGDAWCKDAGEADPSRDGSERDAGLAQQLGGSGDPSLA
jgi:hypothetical protein